MHLWKILKRKNIQNAYNIQKYIQIFVIIFGERNKFQLGIL